MKNIPLSRGLWAVVDDEDYEKLSQHKWYADKKRGGRYYAARNIRRGRGYGQTTTLLMHRAILEAPKGKLVDHKDGNGLNNTRANLRLATPSENGRNCVGHRNGTKLLGTARQKGGKYYMARSRGKYLGRYKTMQEAHEAFLRYEAANPVEDH